jgi:hypothetical protein
MVDRHLLRLRLRHQPLDHLANLIICRLDGGLDIADGRDFCRGFPSLEIVQFYANCNTTFVWHL